MKNQKAKNEKMQVPKQATCNNVAANKECLGNKATKENLEILDIDTRYKDLLFFALCEFRKNANNAFLDFLKVDRKELAELIESFE